MDYIETGLYLPIRFYQKLTEQDRYKRHALGVSLTELNYAYVDCQSLAPFQLVYDNEQFATSIGMDVICADSGERSVFAYNASLWDDVIVTDTLHHLSYNAGGWYVGLTNGKYYLEVTINIPGTSPIVFFSDLFMVGNCDDTLLY